MPATDEAHQSFLLITLMHGDNFETPTRYTNWDSAEPGFTNVPTIEVGRILNSGALDNDETRIILPADDFLRRMCGPEPWSPTKITIEEVCKTDAATERNTVFKGSVTKTRDNYQKRRDTVALFCESEKRGTEIHLGFECTAQCTNQLFDALCGLSRAVFEVTAMIDSLSENNLAFTCTNVTVTSKTGKFWQDGYIEREGIRVHIREWADTAPTFFRTMGLVPLDWVGTTVTFVPGCDQTVDDCRDVYANEGNMNPLGINMLAYDPISEDGSC